MKRPSPEKIEQLRKELYEGIDAGTVDIPEASKLMRKILGMSRQTYAAKILRGVSFQTLQAVETRQGNPTLKTLEEIGKPFGLKVSFIHDVDD
ncbi:MAG: helix-turn-helix transcriptional regulator [Thermodesulfobacteriota bacterium]|nr:helix-turn-helix transcriptional regulator [Thermodesulfobacteriota bacterium]